MSTMKIIPYELTGKVNMPPSKSALHRAIICASLADGKSKVGPVCFSKDVIATINGVEAFGTKIQIISKSLTIDGSTTFLKDETLVDCDESASTLRFLIPFAALGGVNCKFIGRGALPQRPITPYLECLPTAGVTLNCHNSIPLNLSGKLKPGIFKLKGDVSSQFISGLLFVLPLLDGDSEIVLTSKLESSDYVSLTLEILKQFGIAVKKANRKFLVKGNQEYKPISCKIEADWSQAAFFMAAGALGKTVKIGNLSKKSLQPDRKFLKIIKQFGAKASFEKDVLVVSPDKLTAVNNVNVSDCPDLLPILAVVAALSDGTTTISGAARTKIKESNRIKSICEALNLMGADLTETDDGLIIKGVKGLKGATLNSCNDHRIAMALAIASIKATGAVLITDCQSIDKSYPNFFKDFKMLGGKASVVNVGKRY